MRFLNSLPLLPVAVVKALIAADITVAAIGVTVGILGGLWWVTAAEAVLGPVGVWLFWSSLKMRAHADRLLDQADAGAGDRPCAR